MFNEKIAELYDEVVCRGYHDQGRYIEDLLKLIPKESFVLEIGCGTGIIMQALIEGGINCEGLDSSYEMIQRLLHKIPDALVYVEDVRTFQPTDYDYFLSCSGPFSVKEGSIESYIPDKEELREAIGKCVSNSIKGLLINQGIGKSGVKIETSQGTYEKKEEIKGEDIIMTHKLFQDGTLIGEITHNKKRFPLRNILEDYKVEQHGNFLLVQSTSMYHQ